MMMKIKEFQIEDELFLVAAVLMMTVVSELVPLT